MTTNATCLQPQPEYGHEELLEALSKIPRPGCFASYRPINERIPAGLWVKGVGDIALPIEEVQAYDLVAQAQSINSEMQNEGWALPASEFCFKDPGWPGFIQKLCDMAAEILGINRPVRAKVRELHVCDMDIKFTPFFGSLLPCAFGPREVEMPRDYGRLFVCLPSDHTGGHLLFRSLNNTAEYHRTSHCLRWTTSYSEQSFACSHSHVSIHSSRVASGFRFLLVCDLVFDLPVPRPMGDLHPLAIDDLRQALGQWLAKSEEGSGTHCVYHMLETLYTKDPRASMEDEDEYGLRMQRLKVRDLAQVQALQFLSREFPIEIFLTKMRIELDGHLSYQCISDIDPIHGNDDYVRANYQMDEICPMDVWALQVWDLEGNRVLRGVQGRNVFLQGPPIPCENVESERNNATWDDERESYLTSWEFRFNAVLIAPTESLHELLGPVWHPSFDRQLPNENLNSLVLYLSRACLHPHAPESSIEALWELCEKGWEDPIYRPSSPGEPILNGDNTLAVLQIAVNHKAFGIFEKAAERHGGELPVDFFSWIRRWLKTDENEARARFDAIHNGISAAVSAYRFFNDQFDAVDRFVPLEIDTLAEDMARTPKYILGWARKALCFCIDASAYKPLGIEDATAMVDSAFFFDNPSEFISQTVAPRIQQRHGAIAFLLAFRDIMLEQVANGDLPAETVAPIIQERRLVELMDFTEARSRDGFGADTTPYSESQEKRRKPRATINLESLVRFFSNVIQLSTEGNDLLGQLISKISAGAPYIPIEELYTTWLPFLRSLIPLLGANNIPSDSPYCQTMFSVILGVFFKTNIEGKPINYDSLVRKGLKCDCKDICTPLNVFLRDPGQRVFESEAKCVPDMDHLREQLKDVDDIVLHVDKPDSAPTSYRVTKESQRREAWRWEWESGLEQARWQVAQFDQSHLELMLGRPDYMTLFALLLRGIMPNDDNLLNEWNSQLAIRS